MPGLLVGSIALVTGAGSGIGEAIAVAMAEAVRASLRSTSISVRRCVSRGRSARTLSVYACDVSDRNACDESAAKVRSEIGAISVLVNNAGIIRRGKVTDTNARRDWDDTLAVNLDGPYNMVTAFLEQLRETKGAVINIGSIQSFVALPNSAAYTTSKGGMRLLTKALAIEFGPMGIRVNAIGPGFTATPLNASAAEPRLHGEFYRTHTARPDRRPEDIALPAVFLASEMARYITGVTIPVDGGYLAR